MKLTKFFALLCAVLGFVACGNENGADEVATIFMQVDKEVVNIGETVTFTITDADGNDLTSSAVIYDSEWAELEGPTFTPEKSGIFTFIASVGAANSDYLDITVLCAEPVLPANSNDSTKFNHRGLFIDHTGVNCGWCPTVVDLFLDFAKTEWHEHYNEVTVHAGGYASGDPANSAAANSLNTFHNPQGYPEVHLNFYGGLIGNRTTSGLAEKLDGYIKKEGADVGIALAANSDPTKVLLKSQIKAAVAQEYTVNAWLLESGIVCKKQANATKPEHYIYNYALRNFSESVNKMGTNIYGKNIGNLEVGAKYDYNATIKIENKKWNWENMGVLVVVSAKNAQNRWEIVNTAYCKVGESKSYEFVAE